MRNLGCGTVKMEMRKGNELVMNLGSNALASSNVVGGSLQDVGHLQMSLSIVPKTLPTSGRHMWI